MPAIKPALRSPQARTDIENAIDYYLLEAPHMVDHFIDALEKATAHLQRAPGTGSPRYALELNMPGLRFWALTKFPYALFYLEHEDHLWVIRLMHMSQDIPASLRI
jgi:toxin ParE1/3/4